MADLKKDRLARQIEGLYENEALTSDLDDESAGEFLKWAEDKVRKIVDTTGELDDEAAEEAMYPKMKAVRRMARYINSAARGSVDDESRTLDKILRQARMIYGDRFVEPNPEQLASLKTVLKHKPASLVRALNDLFEGEQDGASQEREQ